MPARPVFLLYFLSGVAGLVYQIVWVRSFGNVFGNTTRSAALVTAVFMLGLGVGSYLIGRRADLARRESSLLRAYGWIEIAIAGMGLVLALVIPALEPLSASISSYTVDSRGWHFLSAGSLAFRYVVAAALIAPATLLMGGTLTVLIRFVLHGQLESAGWRIGLLYGVNTAGAALGALLTDTWIVPSVGLFAAQGLAVLLNLIAGIGALALARGRSATPATAHSTSIQSEAVATIGSSSELRRATTAVAVALFASGFAVMGMEIVWFRFLGSVLGSYRFVFSLLLAVLLTSMWLGATLAGWLDRRLRAPLAASMLSQVIFLGATMLLFWTYDPSLKDPTDLIALHGGAGGVRAALIELWYMLRPILWLVALPCIAAGFAYPLANAAVQRHAGTVGGRAGLLYLANTVGNVLGSLVVGFVLLPALGTQRSVLICGLAGALGVLALWRAQSTLDAAAGTVGRRLGFAFGAGTVVLLLVAWSTMSGDALILKAFAEPERRRGFVALHEGETESIAVIDLGRLGRMLYTDAHLMSGTADNAQRYMRTLSHLPLLASEEPRDVLVICFGVGNTVHAASLHESVERVEVVDISRDVLEHAPHFERWNHDVLANPKVHTYVNDGRQHLRMRDAESFDLITLEPPPPSFAGVGALYSREFYELARARLKHGGYFTQWLPAYQVSEHVSRAMVRAFVDVFPGAALLSGHAQHLILIGRKDAPVEIDPMRIRAVLASQNAVATDLRAILMRTPTDVVGTIAGGYEPLRAAVAEDAPLTDDSPANEYDSNVVFRETLVPREFFDVDAVRQWCPTCFQGGRPAPVVADLGRYLDILGAVYASDSFVVTGTDPGRGREGLATSLPRQHLVQLLRAHPYLRTVAPGALARGEGPKAKQAAARSGVRRPLD